MVGDLLRRGGREEDARWQVEELPAAQRAKVQHRAKRLIAEEMTLHDLRRASNLTQVAIAASLGVAQM